MKEKYSIIDKVMIALIVLYSFYYLEPYFVWETYLGGIFREFLGVIPYRTLFGTGAVFLGLVCYSKNRVSKNKGILCVMVLLISVFTLCLAGGIENNSMFSFAWLPYFVVIAYILSPEKIQKKSYHVFSYIFAISLIFPIIWYILTHLGVSIPYSIILPREAIKVTRGWIYKGYPFAVQMRSKWADSQINDYRLCGIFDEAGRVGTLAGLILTNEKYRLKGNWKNIIIFIGGVLSFSLAFYAFTIIYYVMSCSEKGKYRNIVIVFFIIVAYFVFMNIDFTNPNISFFQSRLAISSNGIAGNNRTNSNFDALMDEFYSSNVYDVLFGRGVGAIGHIQEANNIDGSSYKCMIYNFGFVGFGLSIAWIFMFAFCYMKKNSNKLQIISVLVMYLANMYQRPSIFYMGYMLIFFGGIITSVEKTEIHVQLSRINKGE